jgi:hypothetical protein
MAKFNEKLKELNITEEQVSKGLRDKISNYKSTQQAYLETKKDESIDDTVKQELKDSLDNLDNKLVVAIEKWFKNKDAQSERMKKKQEQLRAERGGGSSNAEEEEDDNSDKDDDSDFREQERAEYERRKAQYIRMVEQQRQQQQQLPKKKSGKGVWILVGLVAVVTFGAVILKDK